MNLAYKGYNMVNLRHSSTPNEYKLIENMPMFTLRPQILTKFAKYIFRTFFGVKSGYRTKIVFLQL